MTVRQPGRGRAVASRSRSLSEAHRAVGANWQSGANWLAFEYIAGAELPAPAPESLEFFLVERYRLYAASGGRLGAARSSI